MKSLFSILFFFVMLSGLAQVKPPQQDNTTQTEDLLQSVLENRDTETDFTDLFDMMELYKRKPLNINTATELDLSNFPMLNAKQVASFLAYRNSFGKLISIYELQAIPDWDLATIQGMLPFISLSDSAQFKFKWKDLVQKGNHDLIVRTRGIFEPQAGYADSLALLNKNRYEGSPFNQFLRYRYRYSKNISFGITAENDAGEPFFRGINKRGFDFYSFHFQISNAGKIKNLIIGDFMMQAGQGLHLWNGFAIGKTPFIFSVKRLGTGLRPYTSVNEALFQRGVAFTHAFFKNLTLTLFASRNKLDGSINSDTSKTADSLVFVEEQLNSFYESGFHRTPTEIAKKGRYNRQAIGGRLQYSFKGLKLGLAASRTSFDLNVARGDQPYQWFDFKGNGVKNASVDYEWTYKNILFYGETAVSDPGKWATVNGLIATIDPKLALIVHQRNISPQYYAFMNNPIVEGSGRNERGIYTGFQYQPHKQWQVNAYLDRFAFNWLRFGVDAPSTGYDLLSEIRYLPSKTQNYYVRLRARVRQDNTTDASVRSDYLVNAETGSLRINASYRLSQQVRFQSRLEISNYKQESVNEHGYLLFQDVTFKSANKRSFDISARYALFNTPSFNTRIYAYETDVLYFFSIPPYYGSGSRVYAVFHWNVGRRTDLWIRVARTTWFDRNTIGSSLDMIQSNHRTDGRIQLRWVF